MASQEIPTIQRHEGYIRVRIRLQIRTVNLMVF